MDAKPTRMDLFRTAIPMRRFEHAAASRAEAEAVVVRVEWSDGRVGWGETLPREYVTGETMDGVVRALAEEIWPACCGTSDIGELLAGLCRPGEAGPRRNAAVCAMDLAALPRLCDAEGRLDASALSAASGRAAPARRIGARVSGVLGSADVDRTLRQLRLMRWYGLRDFKLKLGFSDEVDAANLAAVYRRIGKALRKGKCTLRVDVNGGWDAESAPARVAAVAEYGVCVVEQPVFCSAEELTALARRCELPLMADESLLDSADAEALCAAPDRVWWNIRISKNGGLVAALRLARLAAENGVTVTVGCMVGESGILSAAQRRLLQWSPQPRFVEGNYGRFLLAGDLTKKSLRFGYGGRLGVLRGPGLGVAVDASSLGRYGTRVLTLEA